MLKMEQANAKWSLRQNGVRAVFRLSDVSAVMESGKTIKGSRTVITLQMTLTFWTIVVMQLAEEHYRNDFSGFTMTLD